MTETPSEILNSLSSLHEPEDFHALLRIELYPFLDALPAKHKNALIKRLKNAGQAISGIGLVAFEKRSEKIQQGIKALKKHVEMNWKYGYEEQGEMMCEVAGNIAEWLPDLWSVGVDQGSEHKLVHKSLKACYKALQELRGTNSRTEFSDLDNPAIEIEDANGKVVYKVECGTTDHAIFWVWRDLLLSAAILTGVGMNLAQSFVTDLNQLGLSNKMLERLDEKISGPPELKYIPYDMNDKTRDWHAEEKRDLLLNAHFSPAMRAAIPQVKELFIACLVSQFEEDPTAQVFNSIIGNDSQLKERLLSISRERFLKPKSQYTSIVTGFSIFQSARADEELLLLLDLSKGGSYDVTDDVRRRTLAYLGTRPTDIRVKALPHLERGISNSIKFLVEEIERVFPELPAALKYLQLQLEKSRLKNSVPAQPKAAPGPYVSYRSGVKPRQPDPSRDPILKAFCQKAGWTPAEEEDDDSMDEDHYSDDDDYDEPMTAAEKEDIPLGVITTIQQWAKILENWPHKGETEILKQNMRKVFKDGQYFFDVDGVADVLARRCDYGASEPCRQRLGRAIRELYFNFAVDGPEKDRIQTEMPQNLSFAVVW